MSEDKADRRFSMTFTVLLAAKNIEEAKQESLMYLEGIKNGTPIEWFYWGDTFKIIEDGRFVHNLRQK